MIKKNTFNKSIVASLFDRFGNTKRGQLLHYKQMFTSFSDYCIAIVLSLVMVWELSLSQFLWFNCQVDASVKPIWEDNAVRSAKAQRRPSQQTRRLTSYCLCHKRHWRGFIQIRGPTTPRILSVCSNKLRLSIRRHSNSSSQPFSISQLPV